MVDVEIREDAVHDTTVNKNDTRISDDTNTDYSNPEDKEQVVSDKINYELMNNESNYDNPNAEIRKNGEIRANPYLILKNPKTGTYFEKMV